MNEYGLTQALCKALEENAVLMEAVKGIHTHVPETQNPPYLHLHVVDVTDASLLPTRPRANAKIQLDFYSEYRGVVELQGVMGVISRQLNGLTLPLKWKEKVGTACFREHAQHQSLLSDEKTRKGTLTYQCLIQF